MTVDISKNAAASEKLSTWKASWLSSGAVGVLAMAYSMYGIWSGQVVTTDGLAVPIVIALFMSVLVTFAIAMSLRLGFHLAKCDHLSKGSTLLIAVVLCVVFGILGSGPTGPSLTPATVAVGIVLLVIPATIAYQIARTTRDPDSEH